MSSHGLVLWTIAVNPDAPLVDRVHWRLADGRKPPMDIALNQTTGTFQEVTFFLQDEQAPRAKPQADSLRRMQGLPQFNTSLWSPGHYDVDEPGRAAFALTGRDFQVTFEGTEPAVELIDSGMIHFLLDAERRLVGLTLPQLTDDELQTLMTAQVLAPAG
ncbi:MAG TPA: hypothetical protein VKQ36_00560 [Ktedonobacterales bacterium]|nr:hypothetical protein [Ktedonobacterales bacterium]